MVLHSLYEACLKLNNLELICIDLITKTMKYEAYSDETCSYIFNSFLLWENKINGFEVWLLSTQRLGKERYN